MDINQIAKNRRVKRRIFSFSLQWHVTAKCDQTCKHCYMYDSQFYEQEKNNELSLEDCKKVLDDFSGLINRWKVKGSIFFSGGDPILRPDFFEILKYTQTKRLYQVGVMGNSYHLDQPTALELKNSGVSVYQISLDGLKATHDYFRKPGSFDDALRGYKVLQDAGISTTCMYTVSKKNMNELLDVINLVAELGLTAFDFDRLVPVGNGKQLREDVIPGEEYRELLLRVEQEYKKLEAQGCKTQFGHKDNMWGLLRSEQGDYEKLPDLPEGCGVHMGCLIGWQGVSIISDGSVMACRRLPVLIGKVPDQTLADIFINSPVLNEMRNFNEIEKCKDCDLVSNCRGCRAIAYGASNGNYYAKDPQCWRAI